MKSTARNAPKIYSRPMVLSSQPIRFETAQCWNPGKGNLDHPGKGNNGSNWPSTNPNPTPGGAGAPGNGNGNGRK
ncbi:hypothetical protein ACFOU2_15505 [Bacillus songklensis]|uniref:Uncharacterized protein n=1 Tax=Bacillus songklensis TaxID=1069116 RepID=A0ABV8B6E3_9BACI